MFRYSQTNILFERCVPMMQQKYTHYAIKIVYTINTVHRLYQNRAL